MSDPLFSMRGAHCSLGAGSPRAAQVETFQSISGWAQLALTLTRSEPGPAFCFPFSCLCGFISGVFWTWHNFSSLPFAQQVLSLWGQQALP